MQFNFFKPKSIVFFRCIFLGIVLINLSFNFPKSINDPKSKIDSKPNKSAAAYQLYGAYINFQDKTVVPPPGYLKDYGKAFGASTFNTIGRTFSYGWKNKETNEPLDISSDVVDNDNGSGRNRLGSAYTNASDQEKLEGTLMHMQGDNVIANGEQIWKGQPNGNEAYWEIEVPNGYFNVTLSLGDKGNAVNSKHSATVEGYTIISAFTPNPGETRERSMLVKVEDNALTVTGLGGYNTKINYITISETFHEEDAVNGTLAFTPDQKNLNFAIYENINNITTRIEGSGAVALGFIIEDDMPQINDEITESNSWLKLPTSTSVGTLDFDLIKTDLLPGSGRNSTIIATAHGFKPAAFNATINIEEVCSPLSLLDCDALTRSIPVRLDFKSAGLSLQDTTGKPTGFTLALPNNQERFTEDGLISYPYFNTYEPDYLTIAEDNLVVEATKGSNYLNQNNQLNTLGVALEDLLGRFQIETKLLDLDMPTTGNSQAGITFGINEDNYVNLVVVDGDAIKLRKEIAGKSIDGTNNADNITLENLDLNAKTVALRLIIDQNNNKIEAYYAVNDENFKVLATTGKSSLNLPNTLVEGRSASTTLSGKSIAGLFASYNNANTSYKATFDYYTVSEYTLSTPKTELISNASLSLYPNPAVDLLRLKTGPTAKITALTIYNLQGKLVKNFNPKRVKLASVYELPVAQLSAGMYIIKITEKSGASKQLKFIKK